VKLDKRQNFTKAAKIAEWRDAKFCCRSCFTPIRDYWDGEYDHIIPTSIGGNNSMENCKLLCRPCHAKKTKRDRKEIDKTRRILKRMAQVKVKKKIPSRPMPGTKASGWKKPFNSPGVRR
jgi:5-methylcytosine-specific restriction endonuclease McrA